MRIRTINAMQGKTQRNGLDERIETRQQIFEYSKFTIRCDSVPGSLPFFLRTFPSRATPSTTSPCSLQQHYSRPQLQPSPYSYSPSS